MNKPFNNKALKIAEKIFGRTNIKSAELLVSYIRQHKIVVFVPLKNADELAFAMASEGAGIIGNYTVCTFRIMGVGTFMGGIGSNPKAGKKGNYEMTEELRMEMVCKGKHLDRVIDKLYEVHPYEEPAFDIYDIMTRTKSAKDEIIAVKLKKKTLVKNVIRKITKKIDSENLPQRIKNAKVKQAVIDYSETGVINTESFKSQTSFKKGTLYLKKINNIINIEVK
jgi:hypothetical protein